MIVRDDRSDGEAWIMAGMGLPLVLVGALLAVPLSREKREDDRVRKGLCWRCGYDVRASGEKCPECGEAIDVDRGD
jgi:hypothetical protein